MAAKTQVPGEAPEVLHAALERLYRAPLDQFVALRRELVGELRAAGETAAARLLAAAAKPTRGAWALNQVARHRAALLSGLFEAREAAVAAQKHGDPAGVRKTLRSYRESLGEVVRAARELASEAGLELGVMHSRRVAETLQALSAGDAAARAPLLGGVLAQDIDVADPFAGLEAAPARDPLVARPHHSPARPGDGPSRSRPARQPAEADHTAEHEAERERLAERERARQLALEERRQRVASLEAKVKEARSVATAARAALGRAQKQADEADRVAAEAERRLEQARADLSKLTEEARTARWHRPARQ